jgi:hypothetical protein
LEDDEFVEAEEAVEEAVEEAAEGAAVEESDESPEAFSPPPSLLPPSPPLLLTNVKHSPTTLPSTNCIPLTSASISPCFPSVIPSRVSQSSACL